MLFQSRNLRAAFYIMENCFAMFSVQQVKENFIRKMIFSDF